MGLIVIFGRSLVSTTRKNGHRCKKERRKNEHHRKQTDFSLHVEFNMYTIHGEVQFIYFIGYNILQGQIHIFNLNMIIGVI